MFDPPLPPPTFTLPLWLDLTATGVGAIQGAVFSQRVARDRQIDIIGICMIGVAVGAGGGILRDLLLNQLPVALQSNAYLVTAVLAALVGMLLASLVNRLLPLVVLLDAVALGLYLAVGTVKAQGLGLGTVPAAFVGILACTGGSVIRDLLTRSEVALVQVGSFYVMAAIGGAATLLTVNQFAARGWAIAAGVGVTVGLRMLAIRFGWTTPRPRTIDALTEPWIRTGRHRAGNSPGNSDGSPGDQYGDDLPDGQDAR